VPLSEAVHVYSCGLFRDGFTMVMPVMELPDGFAAASERIGIEVADFQSVE
jgi:hypothetical protein